MQTTPRNHTSMAAVHSLVVGITQGEGPGWHNDVMEGTEPWTKRGHEVAASNLTLNPHC